MAHQKSVQYNNACRCKRMVWMPDVYGHYWYDTKDSHHLWEDNRCPDCNTKCFPLGAVSYDGNDRFGEWSCFSTPYVDGNLMDILKPTKETTVNKYSYTECFKILREAKKDGVIREWGYRTNHSGMDYAGTGVMRLDETWDFFLDTDRSKGDIGILNEAAEYVLELRGKMTPNVSTMNDKQCMDELKASGYTIISDNYDDNVPTFTLQTPIRSCLGQYIGFPYFTNGESTGLSMQRTSEDILTFLRKCVEYVRNQK